MATSAPAVDSREPIPAHVWRISAVVVIGSIMSILDTTIVNVALHTLSHDLHSTIASIQWVLTGYLLSLAAVIPVSGWAARRFGTKNVYIFSLVLFTAGSALCGFATTTTELILFRVLQGVGGGMIMPLGQMMMAGAAGPKNMGRVMSVTSIPTLLAPILGPTIGGLILESVSWRWIFFVNVPVGIIGVTAALRILPSIKGAKTDNLDFFGLAMIATGLPLITYGLAEIGTVGTFNSGRVIIPIVAGVILATAFVMRSLRVRNPLLNLHLYRRPTFAAASVSMFLLGGALFGALILLPLYWQDIRGETVLQTGLLTAPQGLGMVFVMPFVGRLVDRYGGGWFALFGVCLTTVATIPLGFIGAHTAIPFLFVVMMFRGAGIGLAFMPVMTAAFASLKREELSDATPQLNVLMRVGGSLGTAVLAVVLQRELLAAKAAPLAGRLSAEAHGFGHAFWWSAGLTAAAIAPAILLLVTERRARSGAAAGPGSGPGGDATLDGRENEHEALEVGAVAEAMA